MITTAQSIQEFKQIQKQVIDNDPEPNNVFEEKIKMYEENKIDDIHIMRLMLASDYEY